MKITTDQCVSVLGGELPVRLREFHLRHAALHAGYENVRDWHPDIPDGWGIFPQAPVENSSVIYRGEAGTFSYSHHHAINKFKERYVAAWSNGLVHEDSPGQQVHYSTSIDGTTWAPYRVLVATDPASGTIRHQCGLYANDDALFVYVNVQNDLSTNAPSMSTHQAKELLMDVYQTSDLDNWTAHEDIARDVYLFEGPRATHDGRLICAGSTPHTDGKLGILQWNKGAHPSQSPSVTKLASENGVIAPEQGTWYQTDGGRIVMFLRDGSLACRLGITWSDDEGKTWAPIRPTDIPNTYSRACAGRLDDGRYFLVGNTYNVLLDRRHLLLALSDDGETFDRMYTIVAGETHRRVEGRHKEDGYQHPNCLADGDRLLVIYSRNKEDIECAAVDCRGL